MEYCPSFHDSLYHGAVVNPSWRDSLYHGDFYGDSWYDDALYHHGVKGMKWGVVRDRSTQLSKKEQRLRTKANENSDTAAFSRRMANSIQNDADAHGIKAKTTGNILKKAGHRAAQAWDANAATEWRQTSTHYAKKAAKQNLKADRIKAKRELQDWGDKANTRYANDSKYRKSGQMGADAEKAIDRYNASKASAKSRYKQAIRDAKYGPMRDNKSDSSVTKRVKQDYRTMDDKQFYNKYYASKNTYAKRVSRSKTGDPYRDRINSTSYKVLRKITGR